YRPDRLVGDHRVRPGRVRWHRTLDLPSHDLQRLALLALVSGLADTDDRGKARAVGRARLSVNQCIALAMIGASLRMADDYRHRSSVREHFRRNVARMGAGREG